MKFDLSKKTLLAAIVISHFYCNTPTEKSQPTTPVLFNQTDTIRSDNYARAVINFNIETPTGNILANSSLNLYVPVNNKGKYKVQRLDADESTNGPFSSLQIVDKAVISKNGEIKILITYELEADRINWETEQDNLTGMYGRSSKQPIQSEGGSLSCSATIIFDEKSMNFISQSSIINDKSSISFKKEASKYIDLNKFALKYLKTRLTTNINWTNEACKTRNCTTGQITEPR